MSQSAALRVVREPDPPPEPRGNPDLTREAAASWTPGQKKCRARKRHNWGPLTVFEHGGGSSYEVVEQCGHCRNRRRADYAPTPYGMRKVSKWTPDYRKPAGEPGAYLLPKGAAPIGEELGDELTAADILSRRIVEVPDDDEDA